MNDPEKHLREFYANESLPPDRLHAILQAGKQARAAQRRRQWYGWGAAMAASLVMGLILAVKWTSPAELSAQQVRVARAATESQILAFFNDPNYALDQESTQPLTLVEWLKERGAPGELAVPAALAHLDSLGCRVLDLGGVEAYIVCFYLDGVPRDAAGNPMPGKRTVTVAGPTGGASAAPMMKPATMLHFIAVPRRQLEGAPAVGDSPNLTSQDGWRLAAWSDADLVYFAISQVDAERFAATVANLAG